MLSKLIQPLVLISLLISLSEAFRQQSVGIRGRLMCGDKPDSGTKVKLWSKKFGRDDQLADARTDANGNYVLQGGKGALLSMDVHFKINKYKLFFPVYTDCNRGILPCQRKIDLTVPSDYVTRTSDVQKWFDGGVLNMEFKFPDESTSCIN
uniref:Transthyretin-like protein n=1 Tax=Meloidogyne javanica TaxID=6303 RepID=A0A915M7I6_MELJA